MKIHYLAFLSLFGCATIAPKPEPITLKNISERVGVMEKPKTTAQAMIGGGKLIGVSAPTSDAFLGWVKSSVGFAKGEMSEAALSQLGPEFGLPHVWRVLTKWDDGSVRVAQIKTIQYLNSTSVLPVNLVQGKTPRQYFSWHPSVLHRIETNDFATQLRITTTVNGTPVVCFPASGQYKFMVVDAAELVVRFRSHCSANGVLNPLSLTSYFTFYADDPVVRIDNVLGNDTREFAIPNMSLTPVTVNGGTLPSIRWVNLPSYGSKAVNLSDGQTMHFKLVVSLDPAFNSSASMVATGEPWGVQLYQDAQASKAFGTAPLPNTRATAAQLAQIHAEADSRALFPAAEPRAFLGTINQSPPSTGSQPAFSSTMSPEIQMAFQGYSAKKMAATLLAVHRESYRGAFLWETNNGVEEPINVMKWPTLFCWNGRCPHYDYSWLHTLTAWYPRTANAGFNTGDGGGWSTHDHQHVALAPLRYSYLATGDIVLEEWLKYYVSMFAFGYFSPAYVNTVEAERAYGRSMKDAIELTEMFPDLPETTVLKQRIEQKKVAYSNAVTTVVNTFGNPASVPFDATDPRVNGGVWGPLQIATGLGNIVAVGWMQGFINEVMTMVPNPDLRILNAASTYFLNDGTLRTYFILNNPSNYVTGSIGEEWFVGFVMAAMKYPTAPGSQFILAHLKPRLDARFVASPGSFFGVYDGWKSY